MNEQMHSARHEQTSYQDHHLPGLSIQNRLTFVGPVIVFIAPISIVGLFIFAVYAAYHWTALVAQSASIVSWVLWFGAACLYMFLALSAVYVLRMAFRAIVETMHGFVGVYHKASEARGQTLKNKLLSAEHENYVVHIDRQGDIVVVPVTQEKVVHNYRQNMLPATVETDTIKALPAPSIKTFHELLLDGTVTQAIGQGKMILGYDQGELRYGTWLDLYSCGVGGVSGSGKSTTVRFLLLQGVLAGAAMVMVDPHIEDEEESLAAQFRMFDAHVFPPCNGKASEVLKRVRWLSKELKRRKAGGIKTPFILFVVDEYNEIMRIKEIRDELSTLLLDIEQGGRKFGIFAMLIGQRWSAQDIGGADIRTSLASTLAHRFTDEDQAKKLIGGKNGARCLELPQGHYLFRDTQGVLSEMVTPLAVADDGEMIQRYLAQHGRVVMSENTIESTLGSAENTVKTPSFERTYSQVFSSENTHENTTENTLLDGMDKKVLWVMQLHADGKQKPEIMRTVWNVNPGETPSYKAAIAEYQQVMRVALERLGA